MLLFDVNGQSLKRTDHFNPATDSVEYLKAKFTFKDSAWSGKTRTALFRLGSDVFKSVLGTDGTCKVPAEVLVGGDSRVARIHGETIFVSLIGEYGTVRITTNEIAVKLNRSGYGDAEIPANPTESEYQQMTAVAADAVAEAEEARAACENARADLVDVKNLFANAIKGNLSGAVVVADDVSPVEHSPAVRVHGKNLIPYGTITFTRNQSYLLDNPLPAGTYTISAHITSSDTDSVYSAVSINSKSEVMKYLALKRGNRVSSTFAVDKPITNIDFCSAYNYSQGEGDTATWSDIQIEESSVVTDYEAYVDPSTVTVKRCGKNLLNLGDVRNGNGSTSKNENGKFTVTGYFASVNTALLHSGERYTVSFNSTRTGEAGGGIAVEFFDETDARITGVYKQNELSATVSFTVPKNTVATRFYFYGSGTSSGTDSATYTKMQVECGSDATSYEPYNGAEYIPAADGTVPGVTSVSPNMTILTDTEGVIVECEYNRDTNKVIDKLINAITALGGTV